MELQEAIELTADASRATDSLVRPKTLLAAGVTKPLIERMIKIRHLRRALHGIHLVGASRLTQRQLHRLTLLRAGDQGCLTAQAGLELRGALDRRAGVSTGLTMHSRAIGYHRTLVEMEGGGDGLIHLQRISEPIVTDDIRGPTVANVGRALADLGSFGAHNKLNYAWSQAEYRGLLVPDQIASEVGDRRRTGTSPVGDLLDTAGSSPTARPIFAARPNCPGCT